MPQENDHDFIQKAEAHSHSQVTVIQEMDMLALLVAVELCCLGIGHTVAVFTDSEAVRFSFLKTWSCNDLCSKWLTRIFEVEESSLCPMWIERVPSQSEPVDSLSRCQVASWMGAVKTHVNFEKIWDNAILNTGYVRDALHRQAPQLQKDAAA